MSGLRTRLVGLLDYVEQVVRLDERVVFRLSEYRLPDGTTFALYPAQTQNLPGVRHDIRETGEPIWLEVERLTRKEPPTPPEELAEWIAVSADPARPPQVKQDRLITVSAAERNDALAKGEVRPEDVMEAPRSRHEKATLPKKYDLRLRLADRPKVSAKIDAWIAGPWQTWAAEELPRRKTIAIYQQLYKIFQLLEVGAGESPIEVAWGVGLAHWQRDHVVIERPLLERRVEFELDDLRGGTIRVRPPSRRPALI